MNKKALDEEFYKTFHSEGWEDPDLLDIKPCDEKGGLCIIRQSSEIKDPPICPFCSKPECFRSSENDKISLNFSPRNPYYDVFYLKKCVQSGEMYLLNQRLTRGFLLDDEFHFGCQFCDSPDLKSEGVFKSPRIYWGNLWVKFYSKYYCNTCGQTTIVIKRSDLVVSVNTSYRKLRPAEKEVIGESKVNEIIEPELKKAFTKVFDEKTSEIIEKIRNETRVSLVKEIEHKRKESVRRKEVEGEKAEYVVFLSRPGGIESFIDKDTNAENQVHQKYSTKKEKFDIFVYEQNVYKKVMDGEKNKMITVNPGISFLGLLILFLKYKNIPLPYVEMYHKAFCETAEYKEDATLPSHVMNTLKNAVNELKREFEYIKGFSIPRAKNSKYICEGNFKFCLILKKSSNEHYTMLFEKFKVAESIPEEA